MRDRKSGSRPRIAVVGSCNLDTVVYTGRLPAAGETVAGHRVLQVPGGKGANQAIAVARAGAAVTMIGAVGDDAAGADLRAALQEAGADTAGLRVSSAPTGSAHITVDSSGANAIVIVAGANAEVTALTHADQDVIARSDVLLLQLELPMPGYLRVRGTGAPSSSKARAWTGVGVVSFSIFCPAKMMTCRSRVDRWPSRSR
jgi:ribokinase